MRWVERAPEDTDSQSLLGRSGYSRRRATRVPDLAIAWIVLPHLGAQVLGVFLIVDLRIRLVQPEVRVPRLFRVRVQLYDVLEVDDRGVIRLPLQVVIARREILLREPLVELLELRVCLRYQRRLRIEAFECLELSDGILPVLCVEHRFSPHLLVSEARRIERVVRKGILWKELVNPAVGFRREKVIPALFL